MAKSYPQFRLGTEEDLIKRFGSGRLQIGFPVKPTPSTELSSQTPPPPQPDTSNQQTPEP